MYKEGEKMKEKICLDMDKVKELTARKFWVWSDLARKAEITTATLYALQAGRRNASPKTMFKIAAALEVEPSEIIKK